MNMMIIRSQKGAALAVSLILLVVATLAAIAATRGSHMQERMTSNQNNKAISLMAAEAGATEFWNWLGDEQESGTMDWDDATWRNGWQASIPTDQTGNHNAGQFGYYWLDPDDIDWQPGFVRVMISGQSGPDNLNPLGRTRVELRFDRPMSSNVDPAFMRGLLAHGNIGIQGNANLTGSGHANGNFNVTGGNSSLNDRTGVDDEGNPITMTASVSGHGSASMSGGGVNQDHVVSGAQTVTVPSASAYINANRDNQGVINSCSIPSGNLNGAVYYCNGNATTSGNFSNVTILATGSVTHGGSAQLGISQELTVMIVAGGNITINGANNTFGVFWAGGNITQNGASILGGSIIAGGNITRNGVFNYVQYDDFGDLGMPMAPPSGLSIESWVEVF